VVENNVVKIQWDSDMDEDKAKKIIVKLGKLLSYLRGVVSTWETRDSQGIDYAYTFPNKEKPDRAMFQLYNLARGHALLKGTNHITIEDIPLLIQVTLSTASRERVKIFELLIGCLGELTTTSVETALNTSPQTAKRTMAEFVALGLVEKELVLGEWRFKLISDFDWFLDREFRQLRNS
jgi:hypothetical protein